MATTKHTTDPAKLAHAFVTGGEIARRVAGINLPKSPAMRSLEEIEELDCLLGMIDAPEFLPGGCMKNLSGCTIFQYVSRP